PQGRASGVPGGRDRAPGQSRAAKAKGMGPGGLGAANGARSACRQSLAVLRTRASPADRRIRPTCPSTGKALGVLSVSVFGADRAIGPVQDRLSQAAAF